MEHLKAITYLRAITLKKKYLSKKNEMTFTVAPKQFFACPFNTKFQFFFFFWGGGYF